MSETAFILLAGGEADRTDQAIESLRREGNACRLVQTPEEALDSIRAVRPDVIVVDGGFCPPERRSDLLKDFRVLAPDAEVVVVDGSPEQPEMGGAADVAFRRIPAPVSTDALCAAVRAAAEQAKRNRSSRALAEQVERCIDFEGILTTNPAMIRVTRRIQRIGDSKLTVLIMGESGTGKELVARALHRHSPRRHKPYRAINCAGLNENLLESELFGHVKGAFTGAVADRKGLFEVADGGTLFLDEVGDMPMSMQAKLLRTLENGEIQPVGASEVRRVDVRIVAATRHDVRAMVDKGTFRDDLYYRLNQATLRLPPLRDRREDIPLLVQHFIERACELHGKKVTSITPEAVRRLAAQQWPGNIRELRSVVEQMVVLAESEVLDVDDLPDSIRATTDIVPVAAFSTAGLTMEQLEKLHIASTLKLTGGNREKTAKMLGIGARTLYRKLREYGLQ